MRRTLSDSRRLAAAWLTVAALALAGCGGSGAPAGSSPLPPRPSTRTCLAGVDLSEGPTTDMPSTLSATGCLSDLASLTPAPDVVPYEVSSPLWADGAVERRFVSLPPSTKIKVAQDGAWTLPEGAVLIIDFAFGDGPGAKSVETRFLIHGKQSWGFFTYKRGSDGVDGTLDDGDGDSVEVQTRNPTTGAPQTIDFAIPSEADCRSCHSNPATAVLGFRTEDLNHDVRYGSVTLNQLTAFDDAGYFDGLAGDPSQLPRFPAPSDTNAPVAQRARSYLQANCAHCHRPGGFASQSQINIDMRWETPLADTHLCDAPRAPIPGLGDLRVHPGEPDDSAVYKRMDTTDLANRMPLLGSVLIDPLGVQVVHDWIASMTSCP